MICNHNRTIIERFPLQAIPSAELPGHSASIQMLIEMSGVHATDTVLDVACGPGLVACEFATHARFVTGMDITSKMIATARERQAEKQLHNLAWQIGDVSLLPFSSNSFDIVLARYSFHHFEKPEIVLSEMIRVCKPGGRVLVADVVMPSDKAESYNQLEKIRDPSHVKALEISEIVRLIHNSRLLDLKIRQHKVEGEVEQQLNISSPAPGDADKIRRLFRSDIDKDHLGINVHLEGEAVRFAIPIVVLAGTKARCLYGLKRPPVAIPGPSFAG